MSNWLKAMRGLMIIYSLSLIGIAVLTRREEYLSSFLSPEILDAMEMFYLPLGIGVLGSFSLIILGMLRR